MKVSNKTFDDVYISNFSEEHLIIEKFDFCTELCFMVLCDIALHL